MSPYVNCFLICLLLSVHASAAYRILFDTKSKQPPQEGALRLMGSDQPFAGRVEIYHSGQWGTICDDNWDLAEAKVVCKQLGFPGAVSAKAGGTYGQGSGPIWLDDINCKGSERLLTSCHFKDWGVTDCSHKEDAGVVCESDNSLESNHSLSVDHSLGLSDNFGALFDSEDDCDFQILVRDPDEKQSGEEQICVHRLILSRYINLDLKNSTSNITVEISHMCHSHVSSFFRYLYTRKIDVTTGSAQCLHQLAYMFGLQQLLEDVSRVFISLLPQDRTFQTQVSLYEYGVRTKDLMLQENVLQFLSWNFEFLVFTPVWNSVSIHMMKALLSRSDLVVKDEAFVLQALEDWIKDRGDAISAEDRVDLLSHIRFSMINNEKLFDIQFNSSMYKNNELFYSKALMKGFQFNSLPFSKIRKHFSNVEDYLPRLYTAKPWSIVIDSTNKQVVRYHNQYNTGRVQNQYSATIPIHNSAIYQQQTISWEAQILMNSYDCSSQGLSCNSYPVARLYASYRNGIVRYKNKLILTCKSENIVFHMQDFKNNRADIPSNTSLPNPCPNDYKFTFVVCPEYI